MKSIKVFFSGKSRQRKRKKIFLLTFLSFLFFACVQSFKKEEITLKRKVFESNQEENQNQGLSKDQRLKEIREKNAKNYDLLAKMKADFDKRNHQFLKKKSDQLSSHGKNLNGDSFLGGKALDNKKIDKRFKPPSDSLFPFKVGEKVVLNLRWSLFSMGEVVLEVLPFFRMEGKFYYQFLMTIKTSALVSFLLRYQYRALSYASLDSLMQASAMETVELESGKIKKTQVKMDYENLLAHYEETVWSNRETIKRIKKKIALKSSQTRDLLNAIYYVRTLDLKKVKKNLVFPVIEKSNLFEGSLQFKKGKRLKTKAGTFNTTMAILNFKRLNRLGRESKFKRIRLWFTEDERKLIVKIELQIKKYFLTGYLNDFRLTSQPVKDSDLKELINTRDKQEDEQK